MPVSKVSPLLAVACLSLSLKTLSRSYKIGCLLQETGKTLHFTVLTTYCLWSGFTLWRHLDIVLLKLLRYLYRASVDSGVDQKKSFLSGVGFWNHMVVGWQDCEWLGQQANSWGYQRQWSLPAREFIFRDWWQSCVEKAFSDFVPG